MVLLFSIMKSHKPRRWPGRPSKSNKMTKAISIKLKSSELSRLKARAAEKRLPVATISRLAILDMLEEE